MYIRFMTGHRDRAARVPTGIFRGARPYQLAPGDWRRAELNRLFDWFAEHLDTPALVSYRPGRRGARNGVCWFRPEAQACISQARYLSWLLNDIGVPVTEHRLSRPGEILWQDHQQVVALPLRP